MINLDPKKNQPVGIDVEDVWRGSVFLSISTRRILFAASPEVPIVSIIETEIHYKKPQRDHSDEVYTIGL